MERKLDGWLEQAVCTGCPARQGCPRTGLPKIMPENAKALTEWELFKLTGTLGAAGYHEMGVRQLVLMRAISRQVNRLQSVEAKQARHNVARKG